MERLERGLLNTLFLVLLILRLPAFTSFVPGPFVYYFFRPILLLGAGFLSIKLSPSYSSCSKKLSSSAMLVAISIGILQISFSLMLGLVEGFGHTPYDRSLLGILLNFWLVASDLFGSEFSRAWVVGYPRRRTKWGSILLATLAWTILFSPWIPSTALKDKVTAVVFLGQTFMPDLARNFFCSYLAAAAGPLPPIIYRFLFYMFERLSPILPNLSWATSALIGTGLPLLGFLMVFEVKSVYDRVRGRRRFEISSIKSTFALGLLAMVFLWFALGLFPYYPAVVATGSMEPAIMPGDIVISQKSPRRLEVGDVIEFRRENDWVVHRIVGIDATDETELLYTKGDANPIQDLKAITRKQVRGKVVFRIPKAGILTLKIREIQRQARSNIEEGR